MNLQLKQRAQNRRRWLSDQNGQAILEFVLILPIVRNVTEYMAVATSPTLSTARTAYDVLPKQEGSALAGIFNDPKQLADHKIATGQPGHKFPAVSLEEFLNYSQGKTLEQLQDEAAQSNETHNYSERGPASQYRYVIDPSDPNKVIDMRHFLVVGSRGKIVAEAFGLGVEIAQSIPKPWGDPDSAFQAQDFFSNALGARFFEQYDQTKNFTSQLHAFLLARAKK